LRTQLAKVKKAHRSELENAKEMRTYALNLTRGVARPQIVAELVKEGHNEAAYLLTFNDEQLALLMAWRSIKTAGAGSSSQIKPKAKPRAGKARAGAGSSSQIKPKAKRKQGAPTVTAKRAGRGSSSQGKAKTKQKKDEPTP
jgi:hypothetical protein